MTHAQCKGDGTLAMAGETELFEAPNQLNHCVAKWFTVSKRFNYGIRYVPIKMNVIFQETYENIN